ncbi:hypothetical protein [Aeromonas veronii]|uniref:hypothetical protein n=1 Tax=Aeromonas veronii TaxID=654 RepID=UPI003D20D3C7
MKTLLLAMAAIASFITGCATPHGAPCSNWSVTCGCYCGAYGTWSGVEPEPLGAQYIAHPDKKMRAQDQATIRTVYIDHNVVLPQIPRVQTRADTWAEGFGGITAVISSTDKSKEQATIDYLKKNNIQIGEMLVDAFTTEFEARSQFSSVKSPIGADAVIRFVVLTYGVEHTFNPLSNEYRTILNAKATMVGPGDKIIWVKNISAESDEQSLATLKELYGNPEIMHKHMSIVAKMCAKMMVDHLLGTQ